MRDAPDAPELEVTRGVLAFEHVSFAFGSDGRDVLSDVSFEVGPGRTLGIVGPPGAGKSTIANLIPRFYDATGGRDHHRRPGHPRGHPAIRCAATSASCSRRPSCSTPR